MAKCEDLAGRQYGKLTVLERGEDVRYGKDEEHFPAWICQCECGAIKLVPGHHLRSGRVRSCGARECRERRHIKPKSEYKPHPRKFARPDEQQLRNIWRGMIQRCYDERTKGYKNYGGRGIGVCEDWRGEDGFNRFYLWAVESGFQPNLSIDKIDNNKDYAPTNCRWATFVEQQNNKRTNVHVTVNGEEMTVARAERMMNVPKNTVNRIRRNKNCTHQEAVNYLQSDRYRRKRGISTFPT